MLNDGTSINSTVTGHCHEWYYQTMLGSNGDVTTQVTCIECGHKESRATKCPR